MQSLEFEFDLGAPEVLRFLVEPSRDDLTLAAVPPSGFTEQARRPNRQDVDRLTAQFLRREVYAVSVNGTFTGEMKADVFAEQDLELSVDYILFLRNSVPRESVERARQLVTEYDAHQHGDLADWIAASTSGWLADEDIQLLGELQARKLGGPRDVNTDQRDALFGVYGQGEWRRSRIDILPGDESTLAGWADRRNASLDLLRVEPVYENAPPQGDGIAEVPHQNPDGAASQAAISDLLDAVTRAILPVECRGGMRRFDQRVLAVFAWPEFKLEWRTIRIRIGCATIRLVVPWLRVRMAVLVLFLYFHLPQDFDQFALGIARNCAVRSVLAGAVIGVVVGNPGAALVSFKAYFLSCLQQDTFTCLNPGIFLVKEVSPWI